MQGPTDELRAEVALRIDDELGSEEDLYGILERIDGAVRDDRPDMVSELSEDQAYQDLAAIEAFASLASDAVQALYAPGSKNRLRQRGHNFAGWSAGAAEKLRRLADELRGALNAVAAALKAVAFTVGVSFPWGVSISITWPS